MRRHNTVRNGQVRRAQPPEHAQEPVPTPPFHQALAESQRVVEQSEAQPPQEPPADWCKGQLLNVRNTGTGYHVTLLGEEYDPRAPERCLMFGNSFDCQSFVSAWYARETGGRPW